MWIFWLGYWIIVPRHEIRKFDSDRIASAIAYCTNTAAEDDADAEDVAACIYAETRIKVEVKKAKRYAPKHLP
jgi:hypothetical protein